VVFVCNQPECTPFRRLLSLRRRFPTHLILDNLPLRIVQLICHSHTPRFIDKSQPLRQLDVVVAEAELRFVVQSLVHPPRNFGE
jgi:hypothetical protein